MKIFKNSYLENGNFRRNIVKDFFISIFEKNFFPKKVVSPYRFFFQNFDICQILTFGYHHRFSHPKKTPDVKFDISNSSRCGIIIFILFKNHTTPILSFRSLPVISIIFFFTEHHPLFPKSGTRTDSSDK